MNDKLNLEDLRTEYFQRLEASVPQRAKGIPYGKISGPLGLTLMALGFFVCPFVFGMLWPTFYANATEKLYVYTIMAVMMFTFLLLPERYYHEDHRTKRWAKKHYPQIYRLIYRFKERAKRDRMVVGPPLLHIEGKGYFFGLYARQRLWEQVATITGFFVLDEQGQLVEDEELFVKAFLTYNYMVIGSVSGQNTDAMERLYFKENVNIYVPRAEKVLKKLRGYFDENGWAYEYNMLLDLLPGLYAAGRDVMHFQEGREKYRQAMGYSFGYEFYYEDAVQEMEMRQAFCKYMLAAHFATLNNARVLSARLIQQIEQDGGGWQKPIALKALKKVWDFGFRTSIFIDQMAQQGIPSEENRRLFREKTAYVKTVMEKVRK